MALAPPSVVSLLAVALLGVVVLQPAASSPPPAAPAICAPTMYTLFSCLPFLSTEAPLTGPPSASCCATLRSILASPESICLCHLTDGGFNQLAGANIDPVRVALLPVMCLAIVPPELPYMCSEGPVPPISRG